MFDFISDSETVKREEEAIKIDELNVAQMKELRDKVSKPKIDFLFILYCFRQKLHILIRFEGLV